jgi:ADP-heptose:LPS heptosyltransferase
VSPVLLVLRALGLGDACTGVPALRGLRRGFPEHRIVLAAPWEIGLWLRGLGLVDDVRPTTGLAALDEEGLRDHVAVNLHGRGPQSHRVLTATRPVRLVAFASAVAGHRDGPAWRHDEHEVDRWCRLVRWAGGECSRADLRLPRPAPPRAGLSGAVVLHPGAAAPARRWPADRWAALAATLADDGHRVVLTGGRSEVGLCAAVSRAARSAEWRDVRSTAGGLALPELAALVGHAGLVVAGDTGVGHLATAFGTRSVLLFGPTPPHCWGPAVDGDRHTVLWHGDQSRPGDPHGRTVDPSLAAISLAEAVDAARTALARSGATASVAAHAVPAQDPRP